MINSTNKPNRGMVLATSLIILLLITLLATSMYANALTQLQMSNHFQLQAKAKQRAEQAFFEAFQLVMLKVNNSDDLTKENRGYYVNTFPLEDINWQDNNLVLSSDLNAKFVIQYSGIAQANSYPYQGESHHLFNVFIYGSAAKQTEFTSRRIIHIKQKQLTTSITSTTSSTSNLIQDKIEALYD